MATPSVQGGIGSDEPIASGKHWLEKAWEETEQPPAIWRRLFRVERALHAMGGIHTLLSADITRRAEGVVPPPGRASASEVEGLYFALIELDTVASQALEEIRAPWLDRA